jgi:SnoaL-like domain
MTDQSTAVLDSTMDASWAVEHFRTFWADPDPTGDIAHLSPDVIGRWPDGKVLHGPDEYRGRLIRIGMLIPDIRLEVLEQAVNGDLAFIRWRGHGTGKKGPFEMFGVDRLKVEGEQLNENIVHFDTATFEALVGAPLSST